MRWASRAFLWGTRCSSRRRSPPRGRAALYGAYFLLRAMPRMPKSLRLPGALYTAISVAGFACALMTGSACYAVGIGLLLFSDTMIAENDFLGNHRVAALILPADYLCHILVTLSALI